MKNEELKELRRTIVEHAKEIWKICKDYAPNDDYLNVVVLDGRVIVVNNQYWKHPDAEVIEFRYDMDTDDFRW